MTRIVAPPLRMTDAEIESAIRDASVPTLVLSLVHMTGDMELIRGPIRPRTAVLGEVQGYLSEEERDALRAQAVDIVKAFRDRGGELPAPPSPEDLHEMMQWLVGETVPAEYVPMMLEEMQLDGDGNGRTFQWGREVTDEERAAFDVIVIGAGMSGLLAAIQLEAAGIPYTVIEKNDAPGGTWYENTYPGCRVDIASHFYCYSFEPNPGWSEYFSRQGELFRYFERCAETYGVRPRIRFRTEVVSAVFDEDGGRWDVTVRGPSGEETLSARSVVSAVGQLSRPRVPDIPGLERFRGPCFHSARWEHEHDLEGRRVAVVGTGASALQIVPEVAKTASKLTVFQRSAAWMFPNPRYHDAVTEGERWLLKNLPFYGRWYRFLLFWPASDGLLPMLQVDPSWPHQDRSVNAANEQQRIMFTEYMRAQVDGDEALLEKVVPKYPPFGKRMLQDNGSWLSTLKRDNVDLVTDGIAEVDETGIRDGAGVHHDLDAIVLATGFHANRFLWPMSIVGRGGASLGERWGEDPRAYLGITVPDFPNFFVLYGPGTNLAHAGSIIFHAECQVRYVMGCIGQMIERGLRTMDCRPEVHDAFAARLEETFSRTVWAHPGVGSWYKNAMNRPTTTSPWRLVDYWGWTREPNLDDYVVE